MNVEKEEQSGFNRFVFACIFLIAIGPIVLVGIGEIIPDAIANFQMEQAIGELKSKGFTVEEVFYKHTAVNDAESIRSRDSSYIPYLNYTTTLNDFTEIANTYNITIIYINKALREFWFIAPPERYGKDQYLINIYCFRIESRHLI